MCDAAILAFIRENYGRARVCDIKDAMSLEGFSAKYVRERLNVMIALGDITSQARRHGREFIMLATF